MNIAELLLPALRWEERAGFDGQRAVIDTAIELGVGGFILFGGAAEQVRALTAELRERSSVPLLIAADLERGAGQQFRGATGLPPLAAIGSLRDETAVRTAAALTAGEARELGLNWIYAPDVDLDIEPKNPIIGTRALGSDPDTVAGLGVAWIEACQQQGVMACAKHFPGHGRTVADSHAELPVVSASREELDRTDLVPFRAAVEAGVASVMSAHISFPALDSSGAPATLSRRILTGLLREEMGFDGLIVTDALIMAGVRAGDTEARATVRALAAGCDLLLYPEDLTGVARELESALDSGVLSDAAIERSLGRRGEWARWASQAATSSTPEPESAAEIAQRAIHVVQGDVERVPRNIRLIVVDDDLGGPYPAPSREPLRDALRHHGFGIDDADAQATLVALFGDIRAWKGRPGYSKKALDGVRNALVDAPNAVILQFGHPRLAPTIGADVPIVSAWGGESAMQTAAAGWLARRMSA